MVVEVVTLFLLVSAGTPSIQSVGTFSGTNAMAMCMLAAEATGISKGSNPQQMSWQLICVPTKVR